MLVCGWRKIATSFCRPEEEHSSAKVTDFSRESAEEADKDDRQDCGSLLFMPLPPYSLPACPGVGTHRESFPEPLGYLCVTCAILPDALTSLDHLSYPI